MSGPRRTGYETLVDTACSEPAYLFVAVLGHDRASACLLGVAKRHDRERTDEERAKKPEGYAPGQTMAALIKVVGRADGGPWTDQGR